MASAPGNLKFLAWIWCTAFLLCFAVTGKSAWSHKSPTFDETLHFVSGWMQTHCHDFRIDAEDPALWKYYVTAGTQSDELRIDRTIPMGQRYHLDVLYNQNRGVDVDALMNAGRSRMIFIGVLLGALIAWWAWRLAGPVAAMVAMAAFCLDPNFLAHAPLIKNDVPMTLIFLALMASVWLLGERATWPRWTLVSLLIGAAITTKFSGLLAIPIVVVALLVRALLPASWTTWNTIAATRGQRLRSAAIMLYGALLAAYIVLWASYDFRRGPAPDVYSKLNLDDISKVWAHYKAIANHDLPNGSADQLARLEQEARPDLFLQAMAWVDSNHLAPVAWLMGFLYTAATSLARPTYLLGRTDLVGRWYYFPIAMAVKTPLATLAAFFLAIVYIASKAIRAGATPLWAKARENAWLLIAAALAPVIYLAVAICSNLNLGIRHVLPVYPFLFILLGVVAARAFRARPKGSASIVGLLLVGLAAECYIAYPNYIPFFNAAAGGSRGGLRLLSDSNLDWGQELPDLADWQRSHPQRQLFLSYFGTADPKFYGIHYVAMPDFTLFPSHEDPDSRPRTYAISGVVLQGQYLTDEQREIYQKFRSRQPAEILGGSIYLYNDP